MQKGILKSVRILVKASIAAIIIPFPCLAGTPAFNVDTKPLDRTKPLPSSLAPIVKKAAPSVVSIYTTKTVRVQNIWAPFFDDPFFRRFFQPPSEMEQQIHGLGSGVIVTSDGYILTSYHVIADADEIKVALNDDKIRLDAKVIGSDPQTDIAVLKVETNGLPAIVMANSDQVEVGDFAIAIGNPFGVGQTVTAGIVSAKGRSHLGLVDFEDFIQTDAPINPGNSGGALVDLEGRLIGINAAIFTRSGGNMGIGFAVSANLARYVCERIIAEGKVTRGYLGVIVQLITPELAEQFKLSDTQGALVAQVYPDSPAARAGLKEGDVIVEFNGHKVSDNSHLRLMVAHTKPGTKVTIKVIRDGKPVSLQATIGELRGEGLARAGRIPPKLFGHGAEKASPLDGVIVDDLTPQLRRQYEIPDHVTGAIVTEVAPESPAAEQLKPGDVILEINKKPVRNAEEAIELSKQVQENKVLLRIWRGGGSRYLVVEAKRSKK
jgi:serine protease Do